MGSCAFLECGPADGAWNMALDSCMMDRAAKGCLDFALRTYTWDPPCISFGRMQEPAVEIDVAAARDSGLDLVRRPTGGRAVWHQHELTYSVVASDSHPLVRGGVEASIRRIGAAIVEALRSCGVDASMTRAGTGSSSPRITGSPCFTSHGRCEIVVSGRKLVGSAQARSGGAFLEHGSIIIRNDQALLADLVRGRSPDTGSRDDLRRRLLDSVCSLDEVAPGLRVGDLPGALSRSFSRAVGCELEPFLLDPSTEALVTGLAARKRTEALGWS